MRDLIIIGGSASSASAGIYIARRNLDFQIITKDLGGEVALSGEVGNYLGFVEGVTHEKGNVTGVDLAKAFRKHLEFYKIDIEEMVEVTEIKVIDGGFSIVGKKGEEDKKYESRAVIVASGAHPRHLNILGEEEFANRGVSYCTTCDGPLFKDKVVAVVGGGNSAMEAAIMLSEGIAKKVYILNINPELKGEEVLIDKLEGSDNVEIIGNVATTQIIGEGMVKSLEYEENETKEKKQIDVDGIFVHIGMIPNSDFVEVEKNKFKEIMVNAKCETNIPGIFAAGDVTDVPYKQIVIAAGQGAIAALSVTNYLNKLSK